MVPIPGSSWTKRRYVAAQARVRPNNALERAVKGLAVGAAGALKIIAPAALAIGVARPAQRGR
jgi:hypothetical protein